MIFFLKQHRATLAILVLAAALRLVLLEIKPPHFDEGVNGWFVDQMVKTGYFHYDPENYHGPFHFYLLFLFQTLLGRHIEALRLPVVLFSLASIWLVTRFERFLPRRVCLLAALAMAISPAEVFYSRYAIHEAELVFFLILATWGLGRFWQDRSALWALGAGLTGMLLTKETYVIHIACFVLTGLCLWGWQWLTGSPESSNLLSANAPLPKLRFPEIATVVGCSLLAVVFFYSGGFLDPSSLKGLYQTYTAWVKTGTQGNGHDKAWYYWCYLIGIFEWPVAIGLIFGVLWSVTGFIQEIRSRWFPRNEQLYYRFLIIYGSGALTAYSLVPYKTPWCIITLIWPFFFVFAHAIDLIRERFGKAIAAGICAPLLGASLSLTVWLNFWHYTDENIPYVYVQTTNDLRKLTGPLFKLIQIDPTNYSMRGHILLESYYPLPWVLGDFTQIGYYNSGKNPETMDADFILADPDRVSQIEPLLKESYFKEPLRLRGGMNTGQLYLRATKFGDVFPERTPEFQPQ